MEYMFRGFYTQPMYLVCIELAAVYVAWIAAVLIINKKTWRVISAVVFVISIVLVALFTLVGRTEGGELVVTPFNSFFIAQDNPEFYRTMFMNVFLFVPFGMSLVFILPEKLRHRVLITVVLGMLLSITVELSQFIFKLGRCETDDVITNTFGTFVGASTLLVYNAIQRLIKKKKDDSDPEGTA